MTTHRASAAVAAEFAARVRLNQRTLRADLEPQYDVIVCGSGWKGRARWGFRPSSIRTVA